MPDTGRQYAVLILDSINDSFKSKCINLAGGWPLMIGRHIDAETVPTDENGYFSSSVVSRRHAEIWKEAGTIWIQDLGSSNGTYINGVRLSEEGVNSIPFELKTDDELIRYSLPAGRL
ncbi:hypothetical protein FRC17_008266 [Serendipita sp. 399]|nr:hypothetical protein FRC17_008266 [Serendipita sp. 399]